MKPTYSSAAASDAPQRLTAVIELLNMQTERLTCTLFTHAIPWWRPFSALRKRNLQPAHGQSSQLTKELLKPEGIGHVRSVTKLFPSHLSGNYRRELLLLVGPAAAKTHLNVLGLTERPVLSAFRAHTCAGPPIAQLCSLLNRDLQRQRARWKGCARISALEPWIGPGLNRNNSNSCAVRLSVRVMLYALNEAAEERRWLTSSSCTDHVGGQAAGISSLKFSIVQWRSVCSRVIMQHLTRLHLSCSGPGYHVVWESRVETRPLLWSQTIRGNNEGEVSADKWATFITSLILMSRVRGSSFWRFIPESTTRHLIPSRPRESCSSSRPSEAAEVAVAAARRGSCPPLQINTAHPCQLHPRLSVRGSDNERTAQRGGSVSQQAVLSADPLPSQPVPQSHTFVSL